MINLKKENKDFFYTVYKDMQEQFPKSELKSFERFMELFSSDNYCLYSAWADDKAVGYFIVFIDCENKNLWLDYVAVLKKYHSRGFGHKIFEILKKYFSKDFNGIYLEVEKPDEANINTIRRIKFYESMNAKKLDIKYFYPNDDGALPMDLYFLPFKQDKVPPKEEVINTIQIVFGSIHSDCKELDTILTQIN